MFSKILIIRSVFVSVSHLSGKHEKWKCFVHFISGDESVLSLRDYEESS